jgi:hypothetical protein
MADLIVEPCPSCGADGIPVLYGLPTYDADEAARDGKVLLGGCIVQGDDIQWQCTGHEPHRWSDGPRWNEAVNAIFDVYENRRR